MVGEAGKIFQIESRSSARSRSASSFFKRVFDLFLVCLTFPFSLPVGLLIALMVRLDSEGPVFFSHQRVGKDGKLFSCYKFRTMVVEAKTVLSKMLEDPELEKEWKGNFKLKDDPRITKVGAFLRKSSLDELPQIWNIFKGEMSLVGPRPIVAEEIEKYGEDFEFYKSVKPGLTGLWQVSGRSDMDYPERVECDKKYSLNSSIWLDLKIILKTLPAVFGRKGAY